MLTIQRPLTLEQVNQIMGLPRRGRHAVLWLNDPSNLSDSQVQWLLTSGDHFANGMRIALGRWGRLTPAQTAAVRRAAQDRSPYGSALPGVEPWPLTPEPFSLDLRAMRGRLSYYTSTQPPNVRVLNEVLEPAAHAGAALWLRIPAAIMVAHLDAGHSVFELRGMRFSCDALVYQAPALPNYPPTPTLGQGKRPRNSVYKGMEVMTDDSTTPGPVDPES